MKKQLLKSALIAVAGVVLMAGSGWALPTLQSGYSWTSADFFYATDLTTSVTGNSQFVIKFENASLESSFGLYTSSGATFEIFSSSDEQGQEKTVTYWNDNGVYKLTAAYTGNTATTTWTTFDSLFGFYFTTSAGYTFKTESSLNSDTLEHILVATSVDNQVYIYLEDLLGGGDLDYDDMVVKGNDIASAPVPEPTTMLLFGCGLLGLSGLTRKRFKA